MPKFRVFIRMLHRASNLPKFVRVCLWKGLESWALRPPPAPHQQHPRQHHRGHCHHCAREQNSNEQAAMCCWKCTLVLVVHCGIKTPVVYKITKRHTWALAISPSPKTHTRTHTSTKDTDNPQGCPTKSTENPRQIARQGPMSHHRRCRCRGRRGCRE